MNSDNLNLSDVTLPNSKNGNPYRLQISVISFDLDGLNEITTLDCFSANKAESHLSFN